MFSCCLENRPIINPSSKAVEYSRSLWYISIAHLLLCITNCIILNFTNAIYEIVLWFLLLQAIRSYNSCYLIAYHLLLILDFLNIFCIIGNIIQHHMLFSEAFCKQVKCSTFYVYCAQLTLLCSLIVYVAGLVYSFRSYKEFKALFNEQVINGNNENPNERELREPLNRERQNMNAFNGRGVVVGENAS